MSFIYEVNGQRVEFEKEPTEKDIDEAALSLKVKPVSQQQKPVEGAGGAAFGVYRPQGRRPESQQDREASKDMPLQTARGVATGTLGAIPDLLNLPGTIYSGVTGNEAPYKVPLGSEEWNQMLPFQSDTPQARLARFGGEVLAPIPTIKGAKAIASLFLLYPNINSVHYLDESYFDNESKSFWEKIGGSSSELLRSDFFTYFENKFGYNPDIRFDGGGKVQPKDLTKINNFNNIQKGVDYYSYSDNLEKQEKADRWFELFVINQKEKQLNKIEFNEFMQLSNELAWEDLD